MLDDDDKPAADPVAELLGDDYSADTGGAPTDADAKPEAATAAPEGEETGAEPKPAETPKPRQAAERRVAHLQARTTEALRRAEEAERRAEAAEAMVRQQANGGADPQARAPAGQDDAARVRAEAERLMAEERVREKRQVVIDAGVKALGPEAWNEKTAMVHSMGALAKPEFMEALVDFDNAHAVVAHLADDPDQLAALLAKRPAAMAAHMGRLSEQLKVAEMAPPKEISRVAPPIKPIGSGRAQPAPDPAKMTSKEFIEFRNRTAPRKLGGQGKAA